MATIEEMKKYAKDKLGAVGGIVGDFARGVSGVADIPKTIYQGTQTAGGANIPTVEDTKKNLLANTPSGGDIARDLGVGVSRIFNNINTPSASFGATPPAAGAALPPVTSTFLDTPPPPVNSEATDFSEFRSAPTIGAVPSPLVSLGARRESVPGWQAPTDIPGNKVLAENPNDAKFSGLMEQLMKVSSTGGPSVGRATQINAIKTAMQSLAPMTSYGNFGVAGMGAETTRRGQDLTASLGARGQDITARGQDIAADSAAEGHGVTARGQDITANENAMDALYHSGILELGKEKLGLEKMKLDARDPESFLKIATTLAPKSKTIDPITGAETETHDIATGIQLLTDSGFPLPKGFNLDGIKTKGPTLREFIAEVRKKGSKKSDAELTQYYNENHKGRK